MLQILRQLLITFLKFPDFSRGQLDEIDTYFSSKKWFKLKSNAVMREWAKERTELKQRVITSVEDQVEETSKQLKKDLEL